jgi:hypothetical protein
MKKASVIIVLLIVSNFAAANTNDLLSLLDDQVEAFNKQDVEKLVSNVTDDMKYFYITADELIIETSGKKAFKAAMTNYFKSGNKPHSVIENHVIDGSRISFKEVVSHVNKKGEKVSSSAIGVYQYKGDKIIRAWYFID